MMDYDEAIQEPRQLAAPNLSSAPFSATHNWPNVNFLIGRRAIQSAIIIIIIVIIIISSSSSRAANAPTPRGAPAWGRARTRVQMKI